MSPTKIIKAIHDAARIYCRENYINWWCFYLEHFDNDGNRIGETTLELEQVYPRYHVLKAMRMAIELYVPEDFQTLEDAKATIIQVGQSANDEMTEPSHSKIVEEAMDEERRKFARYLDSLGPDELRDVPSQPYCRTLPLSEADSLLETFERKWGRIKYPYDGVSVLGVQDRWFVEEVSFSVLKDIFKTRGVNRILQFNCRWPCEMDVELLGDSDAYWSFGDMDWFVIYGDEGDITFGGEWLVSAVKEAWPNWDKRIYKGWNYIYPGETGKD